MRSIAAARFISSSWSVRACSPLRISRRLVCFSEFSGFRWNGLGFYGEQIVIWSEGTESSSSPSPLWRACLIKMASSVYLFWRRKFWVTLCDYNFLGGLSSYVGVCRILESKELISSSSNFLSIYANWSGVARPISTSCTSVCSALEAKNLS